jgi:hypothetical protein
MEKRASDLDPFPQIMNQEKQRPTDPQIPSLSGICSFRANLIKAGPTTSARTLIT